MIEFYEAIRDLMPSTVRTDLFTAALSKPPELSDFPYLVLGGSTPTERSGSGGFPSLCDIPDKVEMTIRFTYVGMTGASLSVVMRNAREALKAGPPLVDGFRVHLARPEALLSIQADRDITASGMHPLVAIDEALLTAHRL